VRSVADHHTAGRAEDVRDALAGRNSRAHRRISWPISDPGTLTIQSVRRTAPQSGTASTATTTPPLVRGSPK
jgi:hypothetical protein